MAALKFSHFNYLFPRPYRCFYHKRAWNVKRLNNILDFKTQYGNAFAPIIQVRHLKYFSFLQVYYSSKATEKKPLNLESPVDYEKVSEETLQSLYDRFEELLETSTYADWDVNYSNGVLTVTLEANCVYVINKQTPNRQIWLSSPRSGPKRYDYINGTWIYKHDEVSLHKLLSKELTDLLQKEANFLVCTYSS